VGEVARGGMGAILKVWDEALDRPLAMKVILSREGVVGESGPGVEGDVRLARFLEEAQVTGRLDHPNIVPVHELGHDDQGGYYFTMRLVQGQDLKRIFELLEDGKEGWTRTRALGVLLKVCEAMAYAHASGVIHRDLKPGNIMVGAYGEVYVMDWGLAKSVGAEDGRDIRIRDPQTGEAGPSPSGISGRPDGSPLITTEGDIIGTPAYMSPEQARGQLDRIDRRSDVYAVGAILYQLLTGRIPYTEPGVGIDGCTVWKSILKGPPPPVHTLAGDVPPQLEAICERAMARDPDKRYRDMGDMAEDLRAFLENRVVNAYRTGPWVEFLMWVRRNRALAATIAASLVLLLGGALTASGILAAKNEEISQQKALAEEAAGRAEAINDFLVHRMLMAATPEEALGKEITVAEVLDNATKEVDGALSGKEEVQAAVRHTLGNVYWRLGRHPQAAEQLAQAYEVRRAALGPDDPDTLSSQNHYGWTLFFMGDTEEGEALLRDCLDRRRRVLGPEHPDTLHSLDSLGDMLTRTGRYAEAEATYRENLEIRERAMGKTDTNTLGTLHRLAVPVKSQGRLDEAEALLRTTLERMTGALPADHPDIIMVTNDLACLLHDMGRLEEAEIFYRQAVEGTRRVHGDDHLMHAVALNNMATLLMDRGERLRDAALFEEAESLCRRSLEIRRSVYPEDHPLLATSLHNFGALLSSLGKPEEAEPMVRQALEIRRKTLGPGHVDTLLSIYGLAAVLKAAGRLAEAEALHREAVEEADKYLAPDHWQGGLFRRGLAAVLEIQGKFAEAEQRYLEAHSRFEAALGPDHGRTLEVRRDLVRLYEKTGKPEEAAAWRKAAD
jgi:serine/threonine protein kinase/tetratricopeptide (TPR) repeat protein